MTDYNLIWKTTKGDPRYLAMAGVHFFQILSILACVVLLMAQAVYGPNKTMLTIALLAALNAAIMWVLAVAAGAKQYLQEIIDKRRIDELLGMTEALQSAESYEDTATVLTATALELLPDFGGALYVFNNSRDRLDLAGSWNIAADQLLSESISPGNCWALKRGKPQINRSETTKLRCLHHGGGGATLEVPMVARGAVYGLLIFAAEDGPDIPDAFAKAIRPAQAMADAMSLALSNISLREKLRTQSLRDPLTGLFNRRYMEDTLERYGNLAERSGTPLSVLMLDLDNFKRLNDEHGHAKGDAVLRDVAAQIVGGLRSSDVVCRYGGEEIIAILPDCSLEQALDDAETIRLRIESLSELHGTPVSASIGVSSASGPSMNVAELVPLADKALYVAKNSGKNVVISSAQKPHEAPVSRLAVAS